MYVTTRARTPLMCCTQDSCGAAVLYHACLCNASVVYLLPQVRQALLRQLGLGKATSGRPFRHMQVAIQLLPVGGGAHFLHLLQAGYQLRLLRRSIRIRKR